MAVYLALLLAFCIRESVQQDPVKDFCRRFGHQSAIVDDRLYIDGGIINYAPLEENRHNYSYSYLSYHDLSKVTKDGMPPINVDSLQKNDSVPDVHGGVLWPDPVNKRLYLFGGEFIADEPPISTSGIYAYDILNDQWDLMYDPANQPASGPVQRVSYGAGVAIPERGEGYYYGGWSSNTTHRDWGDKPPKASSFLVKYVMDKNSWGNISGPDDVGRAEGAMVYVPAGDAGLLVYFGGVKDDGNGNSTAQPMDEILVYEVLSQKWYTQKATGDVPGERERFCAGVATAPDSSSHNIYFYGGADPSSKTPGYDDLFVLSLPSFTYIKLFPDPSEAPLNSTGEKPHNSLTCNIYNSAQMFIVGGTFPADPNYCDSPPQLGVHMADLGKQNPDGVFWEEFDPKKKGYVVPDTVYDVVGGGKDGGATKTKPEGGWNAHDLGVLMGRTASAVAREPTRDVSPGSNLSKGAIAGIAAGAAVAGILAIAAAVFFCWRRREKKKQERAAPQALEVGRSPGQSSSYIDPATTGSRSAMHSPHTPTASSHGGNFSPHSQYPPTEVASRQQEPVELPPNELNGPYHEADGQTFAHHRPPGSAGGWVPQVSAVERRSPTVGSGYGYGYEGGKMTSSRLGTPRSAGGEGHSPVEPWQLRGADAGSKGSPSPGHGSWSNGSDTVCSRPQELMEPQRSQQQSIELGTGRVHETYYHP